MGSSAAWYSPGSVGLTSGWLHPSMSFILSVDLRQSCLTCFSQRPDGPNRTILQKPRLHQPCECVRVMLATFRKLKQPTAILACLKKRGFLLGRQLLGDGFCFGHDSPIKNQGGRVWRTKLGGDATLICQSAMLCGFACAEPGLDDCDEPRIRERGAEDIPLCTCPL